MKKKIILALVAAAMLLGGFAVIRKYVDNRAANLLKGRELYVYPDTPASEVLDTLALYVKREGSLRRVFGKMEVDRYIKPGHYDLKAGASSAYLARMLNNGWQSPVKLVIAGGLRSKGEIARRISRQMMLDSAEVRAALDSPALLKGYGFDTTTVFALFMPATYDMYWTDSLETILGKQKAAVDAYWTEERLAKARKLGLSRMEATILASIVKGESRLPSDYARIAGVYLNRLHIGMKLQADPTVAYCYGYTLDRILRKHLEVDSPYNTYKHFGLPPGPICVPDKEYLDAVLDPDYGGGNLYFCASPSFDGSHRFARTWQEHQRNAREFQSALTQRRRAASK